MRNLRNFIRYFRKRIIIISLVVVLFLGGLVGLAFATSDDTTYESEFVSQMTEWYGEDWFQKLSSYDGLFPREMDITERKGYLAEMYYAYISELPPDGAPFPSGFTSYLHVARQEADRLYTLSWVRDQIEDGKTVDLDIAIRASEVIRKEYPTYAVLCDQIDAVFSGDAEDDMSSALQVGTDSWTTSTSFPDVVLRGHSFPALSKVIKTFNDALKTFALVLACIMFFVGLMSAVLQQQAYEEVIFKRLVTLMVTCGMITFSTMLVLNISNIGTGIMNLLNSNLTTSKVDIHTEIENIKLKIFFNCYSELGDKWYLTALNYIITHANILAMELQMLPSYLSSKIAAIIVLVISMGRAVEIYIMAAMAPLAVCDISSGQGMGMSNTSRFIKNVCAISLQGAIIIVGMHICETLKISYVGDFDGNIASYWGITWNMVLIAFVQIGLVTKSLKISKDIVGIA